MIITKTPFRITLGGGGTDLPYYYHINGGMVFTMAINKYVYITLKPDDFEKLCKLRYSEIEVTNDIFKLKNSRAREALRLHDLNAVEINTCADLSSKSGLGSSGSFLVGLLKAIREFKQLDNSAQTVAEEACTIEIGILKEPVGKQDQYISAYGGVKKFEFLRNDEVIVSNVFFDHDSLINNMHVYSINVFRDASDVLRDQYNGLQSASPQTIETLDIIREYGYRTVELLINNRFGEYGLLLDKYWQVKKSLSSKISLPTVDKLYEDVKQQFGVLGGKIIGAGGGGFLLLYTEKNHHQLEQYMLKANMKRLHYTVDHVGSRVLGNYQ